MKWNQDTFVKIVDEMIIKKFDGVQDRLNEIVGRDSVSRWKSGDRPSLAKLLQLTEIFDCTLDDLQQTEVVGEKEFDQNSQEGGSKTDLVPQAIHDVFDGNDVGLQRVVLMCVEMCQNARILNQQKAQLRQLLNDQFGIGTEVPKPPGQNDDMEIDDVLALISEAM